MSDAAPPTWLDQCAESDFDSLPRFSLSFSPSVPDYRYQFWQNHLSTAHDVTTNARVKLYPQKYVMQVANTDVFPASNYELNSDFPDGKSRRRLYSVPPKGQASDPERSLEESKRRAKSKVRDIALCNQFTHFFTWTLDPALVDRYDADIVYKKLRTFLSNLVRRKHFQYVCIPEFHSLKAGETKPAIHIHGLCILGDVRISRAFSSPRSTGLFTYALPLFDKSGREVYNMVDWKLGFSTCVPLDGDYGKTVSYITKYITKADSKIFGKWYLSSRSLEKSPEIIPLERVPYDEFRNESLLAEKVQFEQSIYLDVKVVSEEHGR